MRAVLWTLGGVAALAMLGLAVRALGRRALARRAALEEVRSMLREGTIEKAPGGARLVRGRLGPLAITADLQTDPRRPRQSPMWRVIAEGPTGFEAPIEARVGGWEGWIDPWLHLGETVMFRPGAGPELSLHAEGLTGDHPLVAVLQRHAEWLSPGAIHARPGMMRVETRYATRPGDQRALLAYLHLMTDMADLPLAPAPRTGTSAAHENRVLPEER